MEDDFSDLPELVKFAASSEKCELKKAHSRIGVN